MKHTRLLLLLALLLVAAGLRAQTLVLHHSDGTTTDVELYTQPRVLFEGDKVLIISTVLNMEYPKDGVLRFTYKGGSLAVNSPKAEADVSRDNDRLVFHGVKSHDKVAVYNAKGIRIPVSLSRQDNDVALPLSAIPSGVYVLSVNGRTSKFTRP